MTKAKTIRILANLPVASAHLTTTAGRVGNKGEALEVPIDEAESYIANGIAVRAPEEQLELPADSAGPDVTESD